MGLITGIVGLPLLPVRATVALAEQIQRQAEEEFYDPALIRAELEEVERLRTEGMVAEEEAAAWEEQLIERMVEAGRRRAR